MSSIRAGDILIANEHCNGKHLRQGTVCKALQSGSGDSTILVEIWFMDEKSELIVSSKASHFIICREMTKRDPHVDAVLSVRYPSGHDVFTTYNDPTNLDKKPSWMVYEPSTTLWPDMIGEKIGIDEAVNKPEQIPLFKNDQILTALNEKQLEMLTKRSDFAYASPDDYGRRCKVLNIEIQTEEDYSGHEIGVAYEVITYELEDGEWIEYDDAWFMEDEFLEFHMPSVASKMKVTYEDHDGRLRNETVDALTLEDAIEMLKDVKQVYYHMST